MLSNQSGNTMRPLCYEHHIEMKLVHMVSGNGAKSAQEPKYACQESDCLVRYTSTDGYFLEPSEGSEVEEEILPRVRCPRDEAPMYLGEVHPEVRSFRLWRCPVCRATSTSGQVLAAAS